MQRLPNRRRIRPGEWLGTAELLCLAALSLVGCRPPATPALPAVPPAAPVAPVAPATPTAAPPETPKASEEKDKKDEKDKSLDSPVAATTKVTEPATAAAPVSGHSAMSELVPHERFLVLSPGGPISIGLVVTLHGADLERALERLVEAAFRAADEDGDGAATWKSVAENPKFQSGQFGNLPANDENERTQLVRMYDADRDGQVDRSELPRFLTRNSGGGRSFALRSSNEYRSSNRARSATRLVLDTDRNGAIDAAEMAAAPERLLQRDADDDELVILSELKEIVDPNDPASQGQMSNRRRTSEPDTAVWLTNPGIELSKRWGMVLFLLQELYAYGDPVGKADWPLVPDLFARLDSDQDGRLERNELPQLLDQPPHLLLEVTFGGTTEQDRSPRIVLRHVDTELTALKPVIRDLTTRLSIELPDVELEFFVNEDPSLTNALQIAMTQFMQFDRDQNGYLEKEEIPERIPGLDATFESFDADRDGKVVLAELQSYLEQRSEVTQAQVRARVADQEDALLTALDHDGDGRLSPREIRQTPDRLRAMDRNQDGVVQSHEIPGSMVIGFVRGNSDQDNQLFAAPALAPVPASDRPKWFQGMDSNHDGEISRREFFGSLDRFATLDVNHDGYLSLDEAAAVPP